MSKPDRFSTKIDVVGDNATKIRTILELKMKKDNRRTYNNAMETIILEYGIEQGIIKKDKEK